MPKTVFVLNGPNLNLLGMREPDIYGRATLADVEKLCRATAKRHGLEVEFRQSNHEGKIIDWIRGACREGGRADHQSGREYHTSVAIPDALATMAAPVIEVHISNIHAREPFRRHSYVSRVARGVICGFGIDGYALAIAGIAAISAPRIDRGAQVREPADAEERPRSITTRSAIWRNCSTRPA